MQWYKKIIKVGNSHAIRIPSEVMDYLRWKKDDKLELSIIKGKNGDSLKITSYK